MKETNVIGGIIPGTEAWRNAMLNVINGSKNFVPNYIRNNQDVKKLLYLMKLDKRYERKPK